MYFGTSLDLAGCFRFRIALMNRIVGWSSRVRLRRAPCQCLAVDIGQYQAVRRMVSARLSTGQRVIHRSKNSLAELRQGVVKLNPLSMRIGVTEMQGFQEIEEKLARAEGLGDELAAGWEAFQLIVMVADRYSRDLSQWSAAWMFAIPSACDGRDCLGQAPSLRRDPAPEVSLPALVGVDDEKAAAGLAALAGTLHQRLLEIAATATVAADARVCAEAAEAAAALREQLAVGGL